ncbi:MAG TPA: biotin/lipoyl-binding protein [Jatrophihabitantaceae bacterium]|nr:biotin/lipoyl-binding protein [Jatrophihabitantaceae bacterium]
MARRGTRLITARPWLSAAIAVVLAGAGTGAYLINRGTPAAQTQATARLVTVARGIVRASVSATGTIAPADEKDVSFGSAGKVTSVRVSAGEKVGKGQVLGTIDKLTLRASLAQDRASLASAKAQLASAQDDSSSTSAQISADKASIKTAKAAVDAAVTALDDATLRSPIAGTVATVNVATGDSTGSSQPASGSTAAATSSSSSSSSGADFVVIGAKKWTVSASVDDTQVGLISKGDQAQLTTDNAAGTIFGTVKSVSVLSTSSSGSATYPVDIAVTGSPAGLHDGASATVSIIYRQLSNVLTVPSLAVQSTGASKYVYLDNDGARVKKTVTTGLTSAGTTQIKSGLSSGDEVYVDVLRGTGTGSSTTGNPQTGTTGRFGGGLGGGFGGGRFGGGQVPGGSGGGAATGGGG